MHYDGGGWITELCVPLWRKNVIYNVGLSRVKLSVGFFKVQFLLLWILLLFLTTFIFLHKFHESWAGEICSSPKAAHSYSNTLLSISKRNFTQRCHRKMILLQQWVLYLQRAGKTTCTVFQASVVWLGAAKATSQTRPPYLKSSGWHCFSELVQNAVVIFVISFLI